jgi:UDP-N-acetylmuramate dehydrogenase
MISESLSKNNTLNAFAGSLPGRLHSKLKPDEPLRRYTTLRVGGLADLYFAATNTDELAEIVAAAQEQNIPYFLLGGGSNVCISDAGVRGLIVHNLCSRAEIGEITRVDAGYNFMTLFQKSARAALSGLEFAVGIPGSVGGALVSNAGAYRQNICDIVVDIDVVEGGERKTVEPSWMQFSYRDSRLRQPDASPATLIATTLRLTPKDRISIMARARDNQRQRIFKQPWYPSAGSFFKNVYDHNLVKLLPELPLPMKEAGVVPAGYLSASCGCKGLTVGGAQISARHGNFVVNRGNATAANIKELTGIVKTRVREKFGVDLHEEVLFVGDWSSAGSPPDSSPPA